MLCENCKKLAYFHSNKKCKQCSAQILNNLYVLCEECSRLNNVCAVCLKKIVNPLYKKKCDTCGS